MLREVGAEPHVGVSGVAHNHLRPQLVGLAARCTGPSFHSNRGVFSSDDDTAQSAHHAVYRLLSGKQNKTFNKLRDDKLRNLKNAVWPI